MEFIVDKVEKTLDIGRQLGKLANKGDVFCLIGDLGTGKTHITKGIALGLEIEEYITSPTFTIVNEYEGRLKFNHFDVYRVNDPDEIEAIGFDEYIFSDAVSVIEWANYIEDILPKKRINIFLDKIPELGDTFRRIKIEYTSDSYDYIKELKL